MASNIKPLTAACILLLMDDGRLRLTDTVAKFLPSFNNEKSRGITIAQLLSHTSGLRIETVYYPFADGEARTLQVAVAKFGQIGPAAPPGTFSYSNAGYNTLGAIIEIVSGQPLEAFMKSRLYDPLGMTDTLNHADTTKLDRMASVYYGRTVGGLGRGKIEFLRGFTPGDPPDIPFIRASGGLITTASDYARFLEMYRLGGVYGATRILKESTVKAATTRQTPWVQVNGQNQSYGYGWFVEASGSFGHTGSDGTMAWVDPAREIIGMILTQSAGGNNPHAQFKRLLAEALR
jgi:CubicO group peptidase (beta-lactamase class C family)